MTAPAVYIGTIAGYADLPSLDLYNLLAPVGEHPVGSTVSRQTLARFGFTAPPSATEAAAQPAENKPPAQSGRTHPVYAVW